MTQIYLLQTYRIFTTGLNHLSNEAYFIVTLDTYFKVTMYSYMLQPEFFTKTYITKILFQRLKVIVKDFLSFTL